MSAKRKDKKGRVLRTGESQRKDLTYQYRYQDVTGKRRTVYAPTLEELRAKEDEINKAQDSGVDYNAGNVTVIELLERYISLKQGVRNATKVGYNFVYNLVKKEDFGYRKIRDIKISDAKLWLMKLQKDGRGYSTITSVRGVVKPAFQMAFEEDILPKNPFEFKLSDVVKNDSKKRIALTKQQLDFEKRRIWVDHQLVRKPDCTYYVEKTKTESGCRFIPMTDNVFKALKSIIECLYACQL